MSHSAIEISFDIFFIPVDTFLIESECLGLLYYICMYLWAICSEYCARFRDYATFGKSEFIPTHKSAVPQTSLLNFRYVKVALHPNAYFLHK